MSKPRPRRSRTRPHRSLAEAARGLTEASPKPHRSRTRPRRSLTEASKIRSVLSFSDSETFLESDLLPAPSKSTRRQVQFSRRHSVVLRLNDERVLSAGGKFNSVAMVDISILETLGTFWERVLTRPHRSLTETSRGLTEALESPSEYSEGLSENPESPSRFDTSEEKKAFRYIRTYVCHYSRILLSRETL